MSDTVAIVEDDPDIRDLLTEMLVAFDFGVISFPDGDVERIRQNNVHARVFLVDLMLPRISGIDLGRALRDIYPDTPLLAMSASRVMLDLAAASGLFSAVFPKPFNLEELVDGVRRCIAVEQNVA